VHFVIFPLALASRHWSWSWACWPQKHSWFELQTPTTGGDISVGTDSRLKCCEFAHPCSALLWNIHDDTLATVYCVAAVALLRRIKHF